MGPPFPSRVHHHTVLVRPLTTYLIVLHSTPKIVLPCPRAFSSGCTHCCPTPTTLSCFIGPNEVARALKPNLRVHPLTIRSSPLPSHHSVSELTHALTPKRPNRESLRSRSRPQNHSLLSNSPNPHTTTLFAAFKRGPPVLGTQNF